MSAGPVFIGIDVAKSELVAAMRPSGESILEMMTAERGAGPAREGIDVIRR